MAVLGVITSSLKYISELFVLHIRKILINGVQASWRTSPLIPLIVFSAQKKVRNRCNDYYAAQTDKASNKACMVDRPRRCTKYNGANDISDTVPNES